MAASHSTSNIFLTTWTRSSWPRLIGRLDWTSGLGGSSDVPTTDDTSSHRVINQHGVGMDGFFSSTQLFKEMYSRGFLAVATTWT